MAIYSCAKKWRQRNRPWSFPRKDHQLTTTSFWMLTFHLGIWKRKKEEKNSNEETSRSNSFFFTLRLIYLGIIVGKIFLSNILMKRKNSHKGADLTSGKHQLEQKLDSLSRDVIIHLRIVQEGNSFLQRSRIQCAGVSMAEGRYTSCKQQSKIWALSLPGWRSGGWQKRLWPAWESFKWEGLCQCRRTA